MCCTCMTQAGYVTTILLSTDESCFYMTTQFVCNHVVTCPCMSCNQIRKEGERERESERDRKMQVARDEIIDNNFIGF